MISGTDQGPGTENGWHYQELIVKGGSAASGHHQGYLCAKEQFPVLTLVVMTFCQNLLNPMPKRIDFTVFKL